MSVDGKCLSCMLCTIFVNAILHNEGEYAAFLRHRPVLFLGGLQYQPFWTTVVDTNWTKQKHINIFV